MADRSRTGRVVVNQGSRDGAITARCEPCSSRRRRGGIASFSAGTGGVEEWLKRHSKHADPAGVRCLGYMAEAT